MWLNSILEQWCLLQPTGTHLCGYYVCEYIQMRTTEKFNNLRNKEVRKRYSQFFSLPSIVWSFIHNCFSPSFKGCKEAERPPTKWPYNSNCGGVGRISSWGGHTWKRRALLSTYISDLMYYDLMHVIEYLLSGNVISLICMCVIYMHQRDLSVVI